MINEGSGNLTEEGGQIRSSSLDSDLGQDAYESVENKNN